MRPSRAFVPGLGVAAAVVVLDQVAKWWILEVVMRPPRVIEVTGFFNLVLGWNRGISFGLFNTGEPWTQWALPAVAVAVAAALVVWMARVDRLGIGAALGLVVGGAVGNLIDRARFGAVVDYLDVHALGFHWPAFNVADAAITVGVAALVLDSLFAGPDRHKREGGQGDADR